MKVLILFGLFLLLSWGYPAPVQAALREHHETNGQVTIHSQANLRDRAGYAWQLVVFHPEPLDTSQTYLRLVGFPGVAEFSHPQPLSILTATNHRLNAPDLFATQSPAANVGQYDLTSILAQLQGNEPLTLTLPLTPTRTLRIPSYLVQEWQQLTQTLSSSKNPSKSA